MKKQSKYFNTLDRDYMIYGTCYEYIFRPNIFQRIFRPMFGKPANRKRLDPRKLRIKQIKIHNI